MGCRLSKQQQSILSIEHYNMLVLGSSQSGKTKLLSTIKGSSNDQRNTLQINTIRLNSRIKLMIFQVSGKAQMTWKNYYPITDIVMFVIDCNQNKHNLIKIKQKLIEIDNSIKINTKIFIVINKIDQLSYKLSNQLNKQVQPTKVNKQIVQIEVNKQVDKQNKQVGQIAYDKQNKQCIKSGSVIQYDNQTTKSICNQNNESIQTKMKLIIQKLNVQKLKHEVSYSYCSAQTKQGIKQLINKLQYFISNNNHSINTINHA